MIITYFIPPEYLGKTFSEKIGKNLKINIICKNISILSPPRIWTYISFEKYPQKIMEKIKEDFFDIFPLVDKCRKLQSLQSLNNTRD